MTKGKFFKAWETIEPETWEAIKESKCYKMNSNNYKASNTIYFLLDQIVTPGKESFILYNRKTGKKSNAKRIFVLQ